MLITTNSQLGPYEILAPIGKGGMGEVFRARDTRLNREVAIKVLPAGVAQDSERLRRFEQEAKAASALNQPNIITIHEIGEVDGTHYIVTEFIDGQTLRDHLKSGRLSLSRVLDIAIQIATALTSAHKARIIHRDIKSENVMLRSDGLVKVLDFGLAKLTEPKPSTMASEAPTIRKVNTDPGTVMGTASYMSPEQARGEEVDNRTDIFSLGVVLYEMVVGKRPFEGLNAIDVMGAILNQEPALLRQYVPDVPGELQRIVSKALRKNREQRYQTNKDLLVDLKDLQHELEIEARLKGRQEAMTDGESVTTVPISTVQTTSSASIIFSELKRHKRGVMLMLAACITILVGVGYSLYYFAKTQKPYSKSAKAAVRVVPFTSFSGLERAPAFSSDGSQIAFVWDGEKGESQNIYVKMIDTGTPLPLTNDGDYKSYPTWSPDGHYIAFYRHSRKRSGIFIIPALGGPEREVLSTASAHLESLLPYLSWSSDGRYIVFSAAETSGGFYRIFKLSVETLEKQALSTIVANSHGDSRATFSPDGKTLVFLRASSISGTGDIFLISADGGEPRRLTSDNKEISGLAWSADGNEIIFSSVRGGNNGLWRISISGGQPELIMPGDFIEVAVSRQGNRLAYVKEVYDTNIWRSLISGHIAQPGTPVQLIASTYGDDSPQYSPDGSKIAFASTRTSNEEIWMCNSDGSGLIQMTNFNGPPTGSPRWSPDSRQIAFDSTVEGSRDVYVISIGGGKPRRLTTDSSDEVLPSWSRDGRWIYFGSSKTGRSEVWKVLVEGGTPIQVTKQGGREAFESVDGKFLYYNKGRAFPGIWRVSADGGEEIQVLENAWQGYWSIDDKGIYFLNPQTMPLSIEFFSFATKQITQVIRLAKWPSFSKPGLAVSSDGKRLLWDQVDRSESDIMLMENFR